MTQYKIIRGPSVFTIGWLPLRRLPSNFSSLKNLGVRSWLGTFVAGMTGNLTPPRLYRDRVELDSWLNKKDFRSALWLFDVELTVDVVKEQAINIDCNDGHRIGYTPYLAFAAIGDRMRQPLLKNVCSLGDEGMTHPLVRETTSEGGRIRKRVEFRLSKFPNFGSRTIVGYWAPYAWMEIDYRLNLDGTTCITLNGSCIPSQSFYSEGGHLCTHDMSNNSATETNSFLRAGDKVQAPARLNSGTRIALPASVLFNW